MDSVAVKLATANLPIMLDPLEVTSFADQVFMDGEAISMESLQTKLRDRYLPENPGKPRAYVKP